MMGMQRGGQLVSPAIGGFVAAAFDIRIPFILHGILCLVAIVPSFWLAVETSPTAVSRARGGRGVLQGDWGDVLRAIRTRQMMAFLAAQFLANIARGVSRGGILNLYAVYAYDVGPATLGMLNTANSVIGLPIGFTSGYLMDRYGRKTTIVPGFALIAASSIFMAFTAFAQVSFPVFVVAFICLHASQSLTGGNMQVLGSDLAPPNARGRFFGLWRLVSEGGGSLSPVIFAAMAEAFGYAPAFGLLGVSALTVALIIGLLVQETIGRYGAYGIADRQEPAPSAPAGSSRA
jgi:MFS family permease